MRIGHASKDENNKARGGQAGDQTGKEVCIRTFYKKPWKYLLRCNDPARAEKMAAACESLCKNDCVGYDQSGRLTLSKELKALNWNYELLRNKCECDCSSFMTVCAQCAGIDIPYASGNAPTTSTMVNVFKKTGYFDVITSSIINEETSLKRGDILVGAPGTHTVMVLDDGIPRHIQTRRTLKRGMSGSDVIIVQKILVKEGYDIGKCGVDGCYGKDTESAIKTFQGEKGLKVDGIVGVKTWCMLEQYN